LKTDLVFKLLFNVINLMAGAKMHHDRMGKRAGTHLMAAGDDAVVHERFDCQIEFGLGHLMAIDTRDRGLPSAMVGRNEKEPAVIDNQPPGEDIPVLAAAQPGSSVESYRSNAWFRQSRSCGRLPIIFQVTQIVSQNYWGAWYNAAKIKMGVA
jgi:hypothetical protein